MSKYNINQKDSVFQTKITPYQSSQLRWHCDPEIFENIDWTQIPEKTIGQPRAEKAIEVGVKMEAPGHHIFVCGPGNIGKMSAVKSILQKIQRPSRERFDYLYIHHFQERDRPLLVCVPPGQGKQLKRQMERFVEKLPEVINNSIHSTALDRKRKQAIAELKKAQTTNMSKLKEEAKALSFSIEEIATADGSFTIDIQPLHRKKAVPLDELLESIQAGRLKGINADELQKIHDELEEKVQKIMDKLFDQERKIRRKIYDQEAKTVGRALQRSSQSFLNEFLDLPVIKKWNEGLMAWVVDHLEVFTQKKQKGKRMKKSSI